MASRVPSSVADEIIENFDAPIGAIMVNELASGVSIDARAARDDAVVVARPILLADEYLE